MFIHLQGTGGTEFLLRIADVELVESYYGGSEVHARNEIYKVVQTPTIVLELIKEANNG